MEGPTASLPHVPQVSAGRGSAPQVPDPLGSGAPGAAPRVVAVNGLRDPVDLPAAEPLRLTLAGLVFPAEVLVHVARSAAPGRPLHRRRLTATGPVVVLDGVDLEPEEAYRVGIEAVGAAGGADSAATFRTAPEGDWAHAVWAPGTPHWCLLRREFTLPDSPILWASLFATASSPAPARQYVHVTTVNGHVAGSGPTLPIGSETRFDGFDVTALLAPGPNTVAVTAHTPAGHRYRARLVVAHADDTRTVIDTDESWRALDVGAAFSPEGDVGTNRYPLPAENRHVAAWPWGFERTGFDDAAWPAARVQPGPDLLVPTPTAKVEHRAVTPRSVHTDERGRTSVDFGRTWIGGLRLRTRGVIGPIRIRYGERLDDGVVRHRMDSGNVYEETVTADGTDRIVVPWGMRVFRYAEIEGLTPEPGDVAAVAQIYPLPPTAARFHSSDPVLNDAWALSAHTVRALNGNLYVDSWTRERLAYEADVYLQQRAHLCLDTDATLGEYSTAFLARTRTWPTEWPFYTVLAAHEAWLRTGDVAPARAIIAELLALLPEAYLDPATGLITKDPGTASALDGDLVDWPPVERDGFVFAPTNTVINALALAAYEAAADLTAALDQPERSAQLRARADRLRAQAARLILDEDAGTFVDGLEADGSPVPHRSVHAAAFALWAGVPGPADADRVARYVAERGLACSVYAAAFLLDGLFRSGHGHTAVRLLTGTGRRSWATMRTLGAGATMEAWDEELKPNLSHSHPWAASPAFLAFEGVLGIRPLTPGYTTFSVWPQLGHLDHADGVLPTVLGAIEVRAQRTGDTLDVRLVVPVGAQAVVRHGDGTEAVRLGAGRHAVRVRASVVESD